MEHTKGELRVIRTTKHAGDIFIKIKGTERKFLCKFYGGGGTEISPSEAEVNVSHFIKCWNAFEEGGIVEELKASCEVGLIATKAIKDINKWMCDSAENEKGLEFHIKQIEAALAKS